MAISCWSRATYGARPRAIGGTRFRIPVCVGVKPTFHIIAHAQIELAKLYITSRESKLDILKRKREPSIYKTQPEREGKKARS